MTGSAGPTPAGEDSVPLRQGEEADVSAPLLSVVVPAYNESHRLGASLRRMVEYLDGRGEPWEILVVDDGSTDDTPDQVRRVTADEPRCRLLQYDCNHGKGYAVRYGMVRAAGDFVLFSDADLATPIEELEQLLSAVRAGSPVAIGSRDIPGAKLERRQSAVRELGGKLFNRCVRLVAVPGIHDTQCGFKMFTRDACRQVFGMCRIDNFSFDVEALYLARRLGLSIAEVPVRWSHQEGSKVRFVRDAWRMLLTLVRIRLTAYPCASAARVAVAGSETRR